MQSHNHSSEESARIECFDILVRTEIKRVLDPSVSGSITISKDNALQALCVLAAARSIVRALLPEANIVMKSIREYVLSSIRTYGDDRAQESLGEVVDSTSDEVLAIKARLEASLSAPPRPRALAADSRAVTDFNTFSRGYLAMEARMAHLYLDDPGV